MDLKLTQPSNITKLQRIAVVFPHRPSTPPHQMASMQRLARTLAEVLRLEFVADYDPQLRHLVHSVYYVPTHTLVEPSRPGIADARLPDIRSHHDLFGGVVPHAFVGTKAITHPLFAPDSYAPPGWSRAFSQQTLYAVLRGTTVFSTEDAYRAGSALLRHGPIRLKPVMASGGRGQSYIETQNALNDALVSPTLSNLAEFGLVLEEHLSEVETFSVGRVHVDDLLATYVGVQHLTRDNKGVAVYGGSDLLFVRGDYDALLRLQLNDIQREAIKLARIYDAAALSCYPGLYASRRNYDIARGKNADGKLRTGVLEQSWRAGGASQAEASALQAFQTEPRLNSLRAFTCERYGSAQPLPPAAQLTYRGDDTEVGFITKFGGILSYGDDK